MSAMDISVTDILSSLWLTCQGMHMDFFTFFSCQQAGPFFLISQPRCATRGKKGCHMCLFGDN
jgi:hypothetical protein